MTTIGERIKSIRKDTKLTQADFAEIFGLSHSHISNIENNREKPSETLVLFICSKLNINYDWLKNGIGEKIVLTGVSRSGKVNYYNTASFEYQKNFKYMNDDELAEYVDAAFYTLSFIRTNFHEKEIGNRYAILQAQRKFFNTLWGINRITNELSENGKIDSESKLDYLVKFNKLLNRAIDELKELALLQLDGKDIELT